jgi:predicted dehydrogenase
MQKIKTGIIGCGKVGHLHAAGLMRIPESEFTAVCSRNPEKAQSFAQKYKVKAYTNISEMIEKSGVEMVTIGTPHPAHAVPSIAAMKAGAHVLVDKPLASSLANCDAMIQAAHKYNRKLGMISQRRLYPPVQRIRQAIDAGKIGNPILGTVTMLGWRDEAYYKSDPWRGKWIEEGGGVLVNQAPHQLDILQWVMGPIDSLFGFWDNLNHSYIEVEDTAVAVIRFKNGSMGNIVVSNSQNPALYGKVHVHGSNGASIGVQTDGGAMFITGMSNILKPPYNDLWTIPGEEPFLDKWKKEDADFFTRINTAEYFHQLQIQDFLQAIIKDRPPMISGEEGRKTVELFTAIYRSKRDQKPIQFPLQPETEREDFDGRLSG